MPAALRLGTNLSTLDQLFLLQLAANVRPELFHYDRQCVVPNLRSPYIHGVPQIPIRPWVVAISGNVGRKSTAYDLREVKLIVPGIGAGDNDPAY